MEISDIVMAVAGRDKDGFFLVTAADEAFIYIADGRSRMVEKPKRKKRSHLKLAAKCEHPSAVKLKGGGRVSNSEIRRALHEYFKSVGEEHGR